MSAELNTHWEVVAEAVQTVLRKSGQNNAYEQLKTLTQGQTMNAKTMAEFVSGLNIVETDKEILLALTPASYIGLAPKLVDII